MNKPRITAFCMIILMMAAMAWAAPVPDTGQTKCYDVAGKEITCPSPGQSLYGQDANYTINPMSYTKLDSSGNTLPDSAAAWSMVKDNVTGLIWEVKTHKDGVKNYTDPHDADNTYTWYDNHPATEDFIKALNDAKYGGFSDWRLPTIKELVYLVNYSIPYPGPMINTNYFPNTAASWYWSSTTDAGYFYFAWIVSFDNGYGSSNHISYDEYVRAVRGGQSGLLGDLVIGSFDTWGCESIGDAAAAGSYTDNGDGTVTDTSTGLMWQQNSSSETMTWEKALAYCEGLNLGGHTDWRLPNIKELRNLVDYSLYGPAINTTYFLNTVSSSYWSSTTLANNTSSARGVNFDYGNDDNGNKSSGGGYVRAVRRGQSGSLSNLIISPLSRAVTKDAGNTTFNVSNTGTGIMPWTAAVTSGGDWLSITSGASGTDAGTITCAYKANTGTASRTGTIRVTATGATGSPKDVTVTQAAHSSVQFLGAWSDGVWVWDKPTNKWSLMDSTSNAMKIAAGKVDTDNVDDLIGVWASGFYIRQSSNGQWLKLSATLPTWIAAGDLNNDGRDDVIGTWTGDGVYFRNSATGNWVKLTSPAIQLASGNIGGILDDLVGVWSDGLWVRYSADASWKKIDAGIPLWITAGDMTGDNRADIVGSYSSGTWYRNSANAAWTKITTPAEQLAAGDIDGDGRDDLVGIWSNAVWVRYGATGQWQQISASKPKWITTGRMAAAIQAAGSLDDPMATGGEVLDLSKEGPGGVDADTGDSTLH